MASRATLAAGSRAARRSSAPPTSATAPSRRHEGADGGGAGRRRGREDEDGPSAEADGADAGRLAKVMRSPPHGGDGDGLSEDETMSQD